MYLNLSWAVCSEPFRKPSRYWEVRASAMGRTISQIGGDGKSMEWRTSRARRQKAEVEEDNGRERGRPNDPQLHPPSTHIPRNSSPSIHNTPALCTRDCIWTGIGQCILEANPVHLFPPDPPCLWELRSRAGRLQNEFRRRESIVL